MVVATFRMAVDNLGEAIARAPEASVQLADFRSTPSADIHGLFWVEGVDAATFDRATAADPTVAEARALAEFDNRSLYRIEFADPGELGVLVYESLVDLDGTILATSVTDAGWHAELFFPDRESLSTFYERCKDLGAEPRVLSLSVDADTFAADEYGLTDEQRETLVMAAERGYFSVPKDISLVRLAEELGISDQAASERLRRGMDRLVRATLLRLTETEQAA